MRTFIKIVLVGLLMLVPTASFAADKGLTVKGVRYFTYNTFTRIVFEIEAAAPYVLTRSADGRSLMLAAYEGPLAAATQVPAIRDGVVAGMELKEMEGRSFIIIHLDLAAGEVKDFVLRGPDRIVLDIMRGVSAPPAPPASMGRQLTVVLDPGHGGGKDTGIVTPRGVEKALTLEWALAVKKILKKKEPALTLVLTREKDQPLSLNDRAAVANAAGSAVFVSIHAASGKEVRVYILDPSDEPVSRAPAGRFDFLGFEAQSEQREMLWQRQQAAYAQQSGSLGRAIAQQFGGEGGPEPLQAPIAVLKAVAAAAVVVEIGTEADAPRAMEAIAKGIEEHVRQKR
jgi:N-acetylmuramoyl-L-alanine amidase